MSHNTAHRDGTPDSAIQRLLGSAPDTERVAAFVAGPGVVRLPVTFDIERLREALDQVEKISKYDGPGVSAVSLTQIPRDQESLKGNNLSGLYWIRPDDTYNEYKREGVVDEHAFSEFVPSFANTYFKQVYDRLSSIVKIGRMRILKKEPMNASAWHRDPEPRLHIPIVTNPGAVMIVNNHCTHLPADGSVYFTDTRGYHTAINGGEQARVHIVAALPQ